MRDSKIRQQIKTNISWRRLGKRALRGVSSTVALRIIADQRLVHLGGNKIRLTGELLTSMRTKEASRFGFLQTCST
jgi:hypothetical protein